MDEECISLNDPEETVPDVDPEAIDTDWNSVPDDKLGAEGQDGDQDEEDDQETEGHDATDGRSDSSDQSFTLKHLGDVRAVGRDEVITLAQKGLDYDRVRGKYDAASAELSSMRASLDRTNMQDMSPEREAAGRRQAEIRDFLAEYGAGIDPAAIPAEVWQSVAGGKTLLGAYQAWELKKLRLESTAAKKNTENKKRSAGSRFSFGNVKPRDAIADDWYDN